MRILAWPASARELGENEKSPDRLNPMLWSEGLEEAGISTWATSLSAQAP